MIYGATADQDFIAILRYINEFTKSIGLSDVQVDTNALGEVCFEMRQKFPHVHGVAKASTFKKVAYFVALFLSKKPIKTEFHVSGGDGDCNDLNAVIAFDIAICSLQDSIIHSNGDVKPIGNPIYVSDHSFLDIIESLSLTEVVDPISYYHLLAVLFEQIVYKSNPKCEYDDPNDEDPFYPRFPDSPCW